MDPNTLALLFLAFLVIAPLGAVAGYVLRSPYSPLQTGIHFITVLLARLQWRAEVPPLPIPANVGAIIVCNHRSSVDPFFIYSNAGRKIHWMVASEYLKMPVFGWFLRMTETIPTNRGGIDTASTKAAMRKARAGGVVGMFPEGRINMSEELLLPVRPGAAMIALAARVPVLPCYIEGSPYHRVPWSPLLLTAHVRVRYGELIDLSPYYDRAEDREVHRELTLRFMREIARLAGRPDYEPQLAGRQWKPRPEEFE